MRQPAARLATLAAAAAPALALVLLCVFLVPGWLHPPLSSAQLQGVTSAQRRVELQQAQERLQEDARATLLSGLAGHAPWHGGRPGWTGHS
jgi:hypothetical protein